MDLPITDFPHLLEELTTQKLEAIVKQLTAIVQV